MTQPGAGVVNDTPLPQLTPLGSQYSTPAEKSMVDGSRKYSDVVRSTSRSTSPAPERVAVELPDSRTFSSEYPVGTETTEAEEVRNDTPSPSIASEVEDEHDDQGSWTKVVHRRSRSKSHDQHTNGKLRPELARAIREAERLGDSSSEPGNTPKEPKGKGCDPRNWGALDLSDEELDVNAQRAALDSWNTAHRIALESDDAQPGPSNKDHDGNKRAKEETNLRPSGHKGRKEDNENSEKVNDKRTKKKGSKAPKETAGAHQGTLNPVKDLVNRVTRQDHKRRERQRTHLSA